MALCNTVVPVKSITGSITYKAQSQDEEALVLAAAQIKVVLVSRTTQSLCIILLGQMLVYDILETLEFTSDRKRMSIVLREIHTGKIVLLSKGADEVIFPSLSSGQDVRKIAEAVSKFSQAGLRTMCLAWRDVEENEYDNWSKKFKDARSSIYNRESKMEEICQQLERSLELLGVTAIEDKLQDGVPEAIACLRKSGINFWMLTGDKLDTAVQIALSCNLILPEPEGQLLYVQGTTEEDVASSLDGVLQSVRMANSKVKDVAFVIDGWALEIALTHSYDSFLELAMLAKTAICCRVTPAQKAQLVQLLKKCDYRTLAIGDGGNDVKMIQEAHVGVGISGREGLQAARAADFSFGKFRFLKRLILVHGRYSYNRTAFLAQYSIYKSLLLCFIQILFSFISGISGTSLFDSFSLMIYNVIYTSFPVMVNSIDKDLSERTVLQHPEILRYCQAGRLINLSTFAVWFGHSLFHALVVFLVTILVYVDEGSDIDTVSAVAFSGCICMQAFVVAIETQSFTIIQHIAIWGNLMLFYILNLGISCFPQSSMYMIVPRLCTERRYWLCMLLIVVMGIGPILAFKYFQFNYLPRTIDILKQIERSQISSSGDVCSTDSENDGILMNIGCARIEHDSICQPLHANSHDPICQPLLANTSLTSIWKESIPTLCQGANHTRTKHM